MTAQTPIQAPDNGSPISRPRAHSHTPGRRIFREFAKNFLGPLLVILAIAVAQHSGVFSALDGRFFDVVTLNQSSRAPAVVIVESDSRFEAKGGQRFAELEARLRRLGAERIGYLDADREAVGAAANDIVIAHTAELLPQNRKWELQRAPGKDATGRALSSARVFAPAEYGIQRSQVARLPGRRGEIPVFETALAGVSPPRDTYLVPIPRAQSIPVLSASQILAGDILADELSGTVVMVVEQETLRGSLYSALTPDRRATSEAIFRAHAINSLRQGPVNLRVTSAEAALLLLIVGLLLALIYRHADPKRIAAVVPLIFTVVLGCVCLLTLKYAGLLLPVSALLLAPWLVTVQRVVERETAQDRRLERTASRAIQGSFNRSALRDGAKLPKFLGSAAEYAGVERSMLIELLPDGTVEAVSSSNASVDDIALEPKALRPILRDLRQSHRVREAADIVPGWEGDARIGWVGAGNQNLYWLHTRPDTATPGKSAQLVRTIVSSFHELSQRRADLNSRSSQDRRYLPVDNKVASAVALVASESEDIRRGLDTIDTAIVIFHLIGSPLHANGAMLEIYREAGLDLYGNSLPEVLLALTELDQQRVNALIEDLMLNGSEMRLPMRKIGEAERMLRVAAPLHAIDGTDRVLVVEAIDMRSINRTAELRRAVAKFIDLQLRNDFEAIFLGSQLAGDERLAPEQVRGIVGQIEQTARRATGRLDEVAGLVREGTDDLTEACYPVDATAVVYEAIERAKTLADELGVTIEADHPDLSGFTMAEPVELRRMLVAMLRVIIADTPQGGVVKCAIEEQEGRTMIRVSGGFGIGFGRLLWLISNYEDGEVGEFRVIGEGIAKVTRWSASVSYWGSEANGFGFNVDLRGLG